MAGPRDLLLGVDIGTTRTKAAVLDVDGRELSWGSAPTPWEQVATGAETSALGLLSAVFRATAQALEAAPPGPVVGAGVTSMAETAVFLDKHGRPCGPSIVWYDTRGEEEASALEEAFGGDGFARHTGLPASALCTLAKLKWLSRQGWPAPARVMSVADWVVHALGGEQASEASLASRTGAVDVPGRRWWDDAIEWSGVPRGSFPRLVQAGERVGKAHLDQARDLAPGSGGAWVSPVASLSAALGRLEGAALTSAGHDHLSAAAGTGAITAAQVLDSCGTSEAIVRAVTPLDRDATAQAVSVGLCVSWHAVPGHDALLIGHPLGLLLDRLLRLIGVAGAPAVDRLDDRARAVAPGRLRVVSNGFFEDPSITGLHPDVTPEALWSAAMEVVVSNAARAVEVASAFAGPAEELVFSGGWANCTGLRRRRLELLPTARWPAVGEAGARGAALFGGCAAGLFEGPGQFPLPADRQLFPA